MKSKKFLFAGGIVLVIILLAVILYFSLMNKNDFSQEIKPVEVKDLSSLMLSVEDFPQNEGWTLKDRAERGKTDVSDYGLSIGWKRGYLATYLRGDLKSENIDYSRVDLYVSEYPVENASLALRTQEADNYTSYDSLSDPLIGDESKAYKVISIDEYGLESIYYQIEFRKNNLLYTLQMYGTRTDYNLLKELAGKTEAKLK